MREEKGLSNLADDIRTGALRLVVLLYYYHITIILYFEVYHSINSSTVVLLPCLLFGALRCALVGVQDVSVFRTSTPDDIRVFSTESVIVSSAELYRGDGGRRLDSGCLLY